MGVQKEKALGKEGFKTGTGERPRGRLCVAGMGLGGGGGVTMRGDSSSDVSWERVPQEFFCAALGGKAGNGERIPRCNRFSNV